MVWLVFGLSFVFMINLLMMDHIRNFSKKLVQSSKKSLRKLRKYTRRSARVGSLKIKEAMQKKPQLKRSLSAPSRSVAPIPSKAWEEVCQGSFKKENKKIYLIQDDDTYI